ncbi:MAG: hypothetical protein A4E58_01569 [Syntrophorhabdus sp. PtaB.Bin006]|nr:MAG: hypothetical protein A4E58_01569 [Syntrophorhabdus sp. PtaB.Bin006]
MFPSMTSTDTGLPVGSADMSAVCSSSSSVFAVLYPVACSPNSSSRFSRLSNRTGSAAGLSKASSASTLSPSMTNTSVSASPSRASSSVSSSPLMNSISSFPSPSMIGASVSPDRIRSTSGSSGTGSSATSCLSLFCRSARAVFCSAVTADDPPAFS